MPSTGALKRPQYKSKEVHLLKLFLNLSTFQRCILFVSLIEAFAYIQCIIALKIL